MRMMVAQNRYIAVVSPVLQTRRTSNEKQGNAYVTLYDRAEDGCAICLKTGVLLTYLYLIYHIFYSMNENDNNK